ncbi:MAG: phosphoenolpyruvate--protein phosphotransferase [Oscillibacter sp.]|nr:phosphoenolpyruvate--protein phosphotransferase [Oscillibacter sp.]
MIKVRGTIIQGGLSIGPIRYLRREEEPRRRRGSGPAEELRRFEAARDRAIVELRRLTSRVAAHWGDSESIIFLVQSMMLDDEEYLRSIRAYIQDASSAEYAVSQAGKELVALFASLDSTYMQARAADARDLSRRLASILAEQPDWGDLRQNAAILMADELGPSETTIPDRGKLLGLVSHHGSPESHTAILAHAIGAPALTDVPVDPAWDGRIAILDGDNGELIVDPDRRTLAAFQPRVRRVLDDMARTGPKKPCRTRDGRIVRLTALVSSAWEATDALAQGAGGVGLYDAKALYTDRRTFPSEEELFTEYQNTILAMRGRPVTFQIPDLSMSRAAGRMEYYRLLHTQMRALLRASSRGPASAALAGPSDAAVYRARNILDRRRLELEAAGIRHGSVTMGAVIASPAAVLHAGKIADAVDFLMIDAHELVESTMQGGIERLADYPAVLWMIRQTVAEAKRRNMQTVLMGDVIRYPQTIQALLDTGIDELAVPLVGLVPLRRLISRLER